VVRVAVRVDPTTAQVSAISDPLPQILEGIPLRLRRILVMLDRKNFVLNPTDCSRFAVHTSVIGDEGIQSNLSIPFQVANCRSLNFAPRLSLQLRGSTKRRGHPAIHAVLKASSGESNISKVEVTLPSGELLDNSHIQTVCTRVNFIVGTCPAGSRIGRAEAMTPLLEHPLVGAAYLRSSSNRLPDLVVDLKGQVDVELSGRIDSVNGRLRTNFESVPDVPVSKFVLDLEGGSKGLLVNSQDLCRSPKSASVKIFGHNGLRAERRTRLQTDCGGARKQRRARHGRTGSRSAVSSTRKAG